MRYPINWEKENEIKKLYTYQARAGFGPRAGSRPVGWYQSHHDKAYDFIMNCIRDLKAASAEIIVKNNGTIILEHNGQRFNIGTNYQVYEYSDLYCRK